MFYFMMYNNTCIYVCMIMFYFIFSLSLLEVDIIKQVMATANLSSSIEVHTVDGFQGREKEAVIISFTRSNEKGQL